ncbi:LCP family protein [Corynebacterium aquilae]|uniref:LCP family protein n=1 Tax=Corynebacterium aquilae TaxID=203263 RepID=UPI000A9B931C|nr:LCP family protein [Corynebacterium aquilae]
MYPSAGSGQTAGHSQGGSYRREVPRPRPAAQPVYRRAADGGYRQQPPAQPVGGLPPAAPRFGASDVNFDAGRADKPRRALPRPRIALKPRGCMRGIALALVLLVFSVVASAVWIDTTINRVPYQPDVRVAGTKGTNWLLVGSDSRQGLTEEDVQRLGTGGDIGSSRTDTIMVLHLDTFGKPTLLSIPRDSYVNVPGIGMDKINASFAAGGPQLLVQTVEQATGLPIDHYAEVGFGGFAGMVDAVGGVTLCPDQDIDDPLAHLNVVAGCQEMDGPTALGFVRTRATAEGDLDRVRRQREFFAALVDETTSASTLLNPWKDFQLAKAVKDSVTIGDGDHVWSLARAAFAVAGGVEQVTMPVGGFEDTDVGNVVLWDQPAAQQLLSSLGAKQQ